MLLSLVIPLYNEEEVLPSLLPQLRRTLAAIDCEYEIVFVNDGSRDRTAYLVRDVCNEDPRIKLLSFSRNFGHQTAITAGIDYAQGDAVVVMDGDLQDPPELLVEMVRLYRTGFDVVSAQRANRDQDTFFKRNTARLFYWLMRRLIDDRMVPQVGDFRLFSRAAVRALQGFREQHRFMRGLVAWCGLREAIIPFCRPARTAGETKYPLRRMIPLAWTAVTSSSGLPLRAALPLGLLMAFVGMGGLTGDALAAGIWRSAWPAWAAVALVQVLCCGIMLVSVGIVGDYVARTYEEIKGRPLYIVNESVNIDPEKYHVDRSLVLPRTQQRVADQIHEVKALGA